MSGVNLEDVEWNYIMTVLSERPWKESNTLLLKIGSQLRIQRDASQGLSQQPHPRAYPPRLPPEITPANSGHSAEQREARSGEG